MWRKPDYLCFTANTAGSTVKLRKSGSPTSVTLETSTDGDNWSTYTIGNTITLSNVGDKVYFRNTSETTTGFSTSTSNCYQFVMTGSLSASGDVTYLLNKSGTDTISSDWCFYRLFYDCKSLTKAPLLSATNLRTACYHSMFRGCSGLTRCPSLPATTLSDQCYMDMFQDCANITTLPELHSLTLPPACYQYMFYKCSKIKISTSQTGEYQTAYRIPTTGTGTVYNSYVMSNMFYGTGGSFTSDPSINTTYYTSNTVV